jgi:hypothetical protein
MRTIAARIASITQLLGCGVEHCTARTLQGGFSAKP